jgi:hypothetical protein
LRHISTQLHVLPAHHQVEKLIGPAEFEIHAFFVGVVCLQQRLQKLVQVDRLFGFEPVAEVLTLKDLLQRELRHQEFDHVTQLERFEPFAVLDDGSA